MKEIMHGHSQLQFQMTIQSEQSFEGAKLNNMLRNWKLSFEETLSKNSTKTIRVD